MTERIIIEQHGLGKTIEIEVNENDAYETAKRLLSDHTSVEDKERVQSVRLVIQFGPEETPDGNASETERPSDTEQDVAMESDVAGPKVPNSDFPSAGPVGPVEKDWDDSDRQVRKHEKAPMGERRTQVLKAMEQLEDGWYTANEIVEQVPDPEGPDRWGYKTVSPALGKLVEEGYMSRRGMGNAEDPWEYKFDYRGREIEFLVPRGGFAHQILRWAVDRDEPFTKHDVDEAFPEEESSTDSAIELLRRKDALDAEDQGWGSDGRLPKLLSVTQRGKVALEEMERHV